MRTSVLISLSFLIVTIASLAIERRNHARRLEILFVGTPTSLSPGHDPITRYRVLKKALGREGINLSYSEDPGAAFTSETLAKFDGVLLYGNWKQRGFMPPSQLRPLLSYVENGGAFVPVHSASACYGGSPEFVRLVGGRFASHGAGVFRARDIEPDHPILKDLKGFEAWDETYVHDQHATDRDILQMRGDEPWTWTRSHGKGRVFYTASGHDHRVWDLPEFQSLLRNGIYWAVGRDYELLEELNLPDLQEIEVSLPDYREQREITRAQAPLSPEESMKLIQVPPGMELSLFACEPDIVNPIHVAWDHRGRAFVIETIDYPNNLQSGNLGHDRITICEDTDGDGRADRFTRFAEELSIPTTMVFARGGVICTNGSEVLFLRDDDGDDHADVREVLFDGLSTHDTHAGISNFRYGVDGWIYATIGYAGFAGTIGGKEQRFRNGVFRFRPDASEMEFLQHTTNNTWGLGFTEEFEIVGSTANGNPSFYLTYPEKSYRLAGLEPPKTPRADDNPLFFPGSMDVRQVDQLDRFTAGAGHAVYTARRFPKPYWNRIAFVCGPTGKLVGNFELERDGAAITARLSPNNLFNSADAWSSPVFAEPGPDGAVWIADWYNLIIQHNPTPNVQSAGIDAEHGKGNAYVTPLRDRNHGRIYRIFPEDTSDDDYPVLDVASPNSLLAGLTHPNLFWRTHALRLVVEKDIESLAPSLEALVSKAQTGSGEALSALFQLGELRPDILRDALGSPFSPLRRIAINLADPSLLKEVFLVDGSIEGDGRSLGDILVGLSRGASDPEIGAALYRLGEEKGSTIFNDLVLRDAWQMAARRQAGGVIAAAAKTGGTGRQAVPENLLPNPGFDENGKAKWSDIRFYRGKRNESVSTGISSRGREGTCLEISSSEVMDCGAAVEIPVTPGTRYRLSGWIRTENLIPARGPGALLNVHGGARTPGVRGTRDWTRVSVEFDSGQRREITVHCLFGGYGGTTGTAWFDDVSLVRIGDHSFASAINSLRNYHAGTGQPEKEIERIHKPDPELHSRGEAVYNRTCIACHGVDGKGVPESFPPLDGSDWVTGNSALPIKIVLHGLAGPITVQGKPYNNVMAPLGPMLDDREIADVLTYVRQKWSNDAPSIDPETVKAIRLKTSGRTRMWTPPELGR